MFKTINRVIGEVSAPRHGGRGRGGSRRRWDSDKSWSHRSGRDRCDD